MLFHELIEKHLDEPGVIISDGQTEYTYARLYRAALGYCRYFTSCGAVPGDRIVVEDGNPIRMLPAILGCIAGGFIFVPISTHLDEEQYHQILKDSAPVVCLNGKEKIQEAEEIVLAERRKFPEDTSVYVIYTSGSSGTPRGVLAAQHQILFCCREINKRLRNSRQDRILCCLPLSFDYGLYQIFLSLMSGAVLYLENSQLLQKLPYLLNKWKITGLPMIPTAAGMLVYSGLLQRGTYPHLRYICFTGEILSKNLIDSLHEILPQTSIVPMYGLTECKRVSVMPLERVDKILAGSCGLPLPGVRVWLRQKDPESGIGELVVEGPNVMEGYWNISDKDSGVFDTDSITGVRRLYTGDDFRIDEEGFLYFCGRRNDIVKIRGFRVSCGWIKQRLQRAKGVLEIAVTGICDLREGERVLVCIYPDDPTVYKAVCEELKKMPDYLRNTKLCMCEKPLPRNRNGKIDVLTLKKYGEAEGK